MATGRTVPKHIRAYVDGFDLSTYATSIGPLSVEFDYSAVAALSETIKGGLCGHATITPGTLNGVFDNTATTGIHTALSGAGVYRTVMVAVGVRAAPVMGDPAFCGVFEQKSYVATPPLEGMTTISVDFGSNDVTNAPTGYGKAWGTILHPLGTETGLNSSTGVDGAAATTAGGYMVYHVAFSDGLFKLKVEDSADNSSWSIILTSSTLTTTALGPLSGTAVLSTTATVRRYLRWQIELIAPTPATTVTFAMAFVRG